MRYRNGAEMLPTRANTEPLPTEVFLSTVGKASAEYWKAIINPAVAPILPIIVTATTAQPSAEEMQKNVA